MIVLYYDSSNKIVTAGEESIVLNANETFTGEVYKYTFYDNEEDYDEVDNQYSTYKIIVRAYPN